MKPVSAEQESGRQPSSVDPVVVSSPHSGAHGPHAAGGALGGKRGGGPERVVRAALREAAGDVCGEAVAIAVGCRCRWRGGAGEREKAAGSAHGDGAGASPSSHASLTGSRRRLWAQLSSHMVPVPEAHGWPQVGHTSGAAACLATPLSEWDNAGDEGYGASSLGGGGGQQSPPKLGGGGGWA